MVNIMSSGTSFKMVVENFVNFLWNMARYIQNWPFGLKSLTQFFSTRKMVKWKELTKKLTCQKNHQAGWNWKILKLVKTTGSWWLLIMKHWAQKPPKSISNRSTNPVSIHVHLSYANWSWSKGLYFRYGFWNGTMLGSEK